MSSADLLISDASTALFEFAALNKPVVWCDFLKLRWSYRGIFSYRFKKRMDQDIHKYADIAAHVANYKDLLSIVAKQLAHPEEHEPQRRNYSEQLLGRLDGNVSSRIVKSLLEY
jgi:CDP-glycerol glycerophosphotransferase (TagB/SpsB family)